jgi:CRP-like cAMP-binding protein
MPSTFKRGSEMPRRPNVDAIVEQAIQRLKQIEDRVTRDQRIADELRRLRDAVNELERTILSRLSSEPVPAAERTEPAAHQPPATRTDAVKRAIAPRGQNQAKILEALEGSRSMTASEISMLTGISAATVSTTLTKMAKNGELAKAERGYRLPG